MFSTESVSKQVPSQGRRSILHLILFRKT